MSDKRLFLVRGTFKPDVEAQRQAIHDTYNEHLAQRWPRVRLGGSVQDDAGRRLGVVLVLEADDRGQVERFVETSPYTKAGLYARTEIEVYDIEVGSLA